MAIDAGIAKETPLERVKAALRESVHDLLVLTGRDWVRWLTGYARFGGGLTSILVRPDAPATLFLPSYEIDVARQMIDVAAVNLTPFTDDGFGMLEDPHEALVEAFRSSGIAGDAHVGAVNSDWLADRYLMMNAPVDVGNQAGALRMVKSANEVGEMARRVELCWLAHRALARALDEGATEIDLYSLARSTVEHEWGTPIDMNADVVSGPSCALIGAPICVPSSRVVQPGETVIADLVIGADGYYADVTWTHVRGSNPDAEKLREGLIGVMVETARGLVPGRRASEVYRDMAARIKELAPDDTFRHHGGHGVGLSGYEPPFLTPYDDTVLQVGMTLAVEPGSYGADHGVRVENDYLVTENGGLEIPGRPLDMDLTK